MKSSPQSLTDSQEASPRNAAPADPQLIVEAVLRRAEQQGYVVTRQVREEMTRAGADPDRWKDVIKAARPQLTYRGGRYHYTPPASPVREAQERAHHAIHAAVHQLVEEFRAAVADQERREADRLIFIQPATIQLADGSDHHVMTKDISASGIRLLGTRDLLGQKVHVIVPALSGAPIGFAARIVWTCRVGDDLYENGGVFMELLR